MAIKFIYRFFVLVSLLTLLIYQAGETSVKAAVSFDPANVVFQEKISGLTQPLFIANAGDGSGRLFIVERAGRIRLFVNGQLSSIPFLDIHSIVNSESGEQGLLSLAFHPDYETNGQFYTVHTDQAGSLVLSRFERSSINPNLADPTSRIILLTIAHPTYQNHNGGTLAFGPDGFLYWSTGDGGSGGDPFNNAQNLNSLLGKVLRLDINKSDPGLNYSIPPSNPFYNTPSKRGEIWAYGLRNPWRFSFDRQTGDMFIADVGQSSREEINFQPDTSLGGENYGWRVMEGTKCYNPSSGCDQSGKVLPIAEYDHSIGCSVTGGYRYRGSLYPSLQGRYFYGDYCTGAFFTLQGNPVSGWTVTPLSDTPYLISSFGEDESGELYLADYLTGKVYQIGYKTFNDVPLDYWAWDYIERLYDSNITSGCNTSPLRYCPTNTVTRDQMAVFLLRGKHGSNYAPPTATGVFQDVPTNYWAADWIEQLAAEGITSGCNASPKQYCPTTPVTRDQMAVFLLKARHGSSYVPPTATGVFEDVPTDYWAAAWIEQLAAEGITSGCGGGNYCPTTPVTRDQMAVFLVKNFNLP